MIEFKVYQAQKGLFNITYGKEHNDFKLLNKEDLIKFIKELLK